MWWKKTKINNINDAVKAIYNIGILTFNREEKIKNILTMLLEVIKEEQKEKIINLIIEQDEESQI